MAGGVRGGKGVQAESIRYRMYALRVEEEGLQPAGDEGDEGRDGEFNEGREGFEVEAGAVEGQQWVGYGIGGVEQQAQGCRVGG